jgi:lysophospholipase L1-like esterase
LLAKLAGELNIKFIDPTAKLRHHALTEMLYHQGLHFNAYGYSLYATQLAQELAPDLILP